MTRWLALDVGGVRIGVAVSDGTGFLASPYKTLLVTGDEAQTWAAIQQLIRETEAEGLVIGLPISLDGQIHAQAEHIQAFAERLKEHVTIPLAFWDERLSTVEAERLLAERSREQGMRTGGKYRRGKSQQQAQRHGHASTHARRRRKQTAYGIDALAATVILQEYLDSLDSKTEGTT